MPNLNHLNQTPPFAPPASSGQARLAHSIENAADRLDVGRTTVFELIRTGRLKALKLNGRTVIPESALLELLASLPSAV